MPNEAQTVAGLDIGTTDVCMFIGEYGFSGLVEVTGMGASAVSRYAKGHGDQHRCHCTRHQESENRS